MENASKALLIAGGVLILIILVSLILLVRNNVTQYFASDEVLQIAQDKTKFNEQFTRFQRDNVQGYELISLANLVIDYNERISSEVDTNNVQAVPVGILIRLYGDTENFRNIEKKDIQDKFTYDGTLRLLKKQTLNYTTDSGIVNRKLISDTNTTLKYMLDEIHRIETIPHIAALTKNINRIFPNGTLTEEQKKNAILSINTSLGEKVYNEKNAKDEYKRFLDDQNNYKENIYKYYEYTQFKKAYFKCSKIEYDNETGKVNYISFVYTGKIE